MSFTEYQFTDRCQPRLRVAYYCLLNLEKSIREKSEECSEEDSTEPNIESLRQQLDAMLSLMESALDMPKTLRFSCITSKDLSKLNIRPAGYLALKSNCKERVTTTICLGEDELWSSPNLYHHLQLLERQIPKRTVGSSRAWIETFFFRVSAMLSNKRTIINNESDQDVRLLWWREPYFSSSSITSGSADYYTAILADDPFPSPRMLFDSPSVDHIHNFDMPQHSGFFTIIDVDSFDPWKQAPRAIMEMYTCGVELHGPKILRGALTDGHQWVFLLMKFDDDYNGAFYMQSEVVQLMVTRNLSGEVTIHGPWPDVIAAILAHWIQNGSTDFGSDDWFEQAHDKLTI